MSGFVESFLLGWWVVSLEMSFMPCWHLGSSLSFSPSLVLFAMKEDNEKVPTLLTDYILKGESSPWGPWSGGFPGSPPPGLPLKGWEAALLRSLPRASFHPDRAGHTGPGAAGGRLWGPHRNGVLSLHVARRQEKEIPSPWSHQSTSTLEQWNQIVKVLESSGYSVGKNQSPGLRVLVSAAWSHA